jgi:hypothetical protein
MKEFKHINARSIEEASLYFRNSAEKRGYWLVVLTFWEK